MYYYAINVLKHGQGSSYNRLNAKSNILPFKIKQNNTFIDEGDVSELSFLIKVDDKFVLDCVNISESVSDIIENRT